MTLFFLSALCCIVNTYGLQPYNTALAATVAVTTPKDSMVKGTQQRIKATNIKTKRMSKNNNLPVIKVYKSAENSDELIITGLNPGIAEIMVEQNFNGNRTFRTFTILVKETDSSFDRFKEAWNNA